MFFIETKIVVHGRYTLLKDVTFHPTVKASQRTKTPSTSLVITKSKLKVIIFSNTEVKEVFVDNLMFRLSSFVFLNFLSGLRDRGSSV